MIPVQTSSMVMLLLAQISFSRGLSLDSLHSEAVNQIANITYRAGKDDSSSLTSMFSPRMDFEQWKPLTGRGDPLRNDPTYDYEPPVLERVHYWADDTRLEREHYPEKKSEVLMLGVSSRKPSVTPRQPPIPPRKHVQRPSPLKYEDFTYKISDHYPMTILVPPPPPPPGHQLPLFILSDDASFTTNNVSPQIKVTNTPNQVIKQVTSSPDHLTSLYTLQEANLIYQSSTTTQNWINDTKYVANNAVSSDYAGWGPTTPIDDNDVANDTHNLISNEYIELSKHPYSFYKPVLSESPPHYESPQMSSLTLSTFIPTALPPTVSPESTTVPFMQVTWPTEKTTFNVPIPTEIPETTTVNTFRPTSIPKLKPKPIMNIFDMLTPMMSMPMVNDPDRPEDNLYAHASENIQVFNEQNTEDIIQIETMQTMQPPPPVSSIETPKTPFKQQFHVNSDIFNNKPAPFTHGPYLHNRFTTPIPTTLYELSENLKSTTETPTIPYLIIQGHSKVKTYGSKPKLDERNENDTISNEILKPKETIEVKHLHPIKEKLAKKSDRMDAKRKSRAQNLKALIEKGLGSFEIQEIDLGIKYDVSDGSEVPVEIYRKGIVDSDENKYVSSTKLTNDNRNKRQIDLEDLIPFDEDTIEEYVYNFLEGKKNETSITGLIAQAVTSNTADEVVDELEDDDDSEQEEER